MPGKSPNDSRVDSAYARAILIDKNYKQVASHVDEVLRQKIKAGEYIDFVRLVPRDRVLQEEDHQMVMVQKGEDTFYVPAWARDRDTGGINSYFKWEQAFRVFSNIYLEEYPQKAGELLQCHHIIHTTLLSYVWDNVYCYDREFRLHLSLNPGRSWSVVLQQAWNMYIKDRILGTKRSFGEEQHSESSPASGGGKKKLCYSYNLGCCQYGTCCKFDHRCAFCSKFGHGSQSCR